MTDAIPSQFGHASVSTRHSKSILTKSSGFINSFDYTLNPYAGCTFSCTYCYAAFFARTDTQHADWGQWVEVKVNALELLRKKRKRPLTGKAIYMSSVTDPYQPIERRLELTREILLELITYHQPRLVIQTRGTLILRDIDILKQFEHLQVNVTVTTDDEDIRKVFEPLCPSAEQRLNTVTQLSDAGIQTCITMTPLLPLKQPEQFAHRLKRTGASKFIVQGFHSGKTRFAAGTGDAAKQVAQSLKWDASAYTKTVNVLKSVLPDLHEGQQGFAPDI
ncbi:MAG: radical SAM protein [Chloroflexota bacterium]